MTAATIPAAYRGDRLRMLTVAVVFAVLYVASAQLGKLMVNPVTTVTPIWPAAGLALAALLHWGWRSMWPALVVAAAATGTFFNTDTVVEAMGPILGNILGPLTGAWLVERFARGRRFPERAVDVLVFVFAGAGVAAAVSATFGAVGLTLTGEMPWDRFLPIWWQWCVSDFVGAVVLVPALLAWAAPALPHDGENRGGAWRSVEAIVLILISILGAQASFGGWPFPPDRHALEYLCIPALLWAAFRFPHRGVATAIAGIGMLAVINTLQGHGSFAAPIWSDVGESLLLLQIFLVCVVGMTLATAAVVRERLAQAATLETTVARRTAELRAELTERIQAEQAAEGSRAMLRLIIDMLPQAVSWKNRSGVYLGCNRPVVESLGESSPGDLVGKSDAELPWSAETKEFIRTVDERVMASGHPELRSIHRQQLPDGRTVTLESSKVPLRDPTGRVVGILGTTEDITAREQIEGELRAARSDLEARVAERTAALARANEGLQASEERFSRAILDAPIPIMLYAEDGEVFSVNRAWTALTGYRHEDIPTVKHWVDLAYPPDQRASVHAVIREIYQLEHAAENGEFPILTADGSQRVWDFSSAPLGRSPDGRRMVISSAKDVTMRRASEDALRHSEERLQAALQAGRMSVWQFDVGKGSVQWNAEQNQEWQGWGPEAFPNTFDAFLADVPPEDHQMLTESIARCIAERTPVNAQYRYRRHHDGQMRWLESRAQPRLDADGRVTSITGLTQDITKRREAEDALRESQRRLRLALRGGAMGFWRSDFKAGVEEWDEQVQRFSGWEPGTFPGTPDAFLARVHPDDRAGLLETVQHTLEQRCEAVLCYRVIWPDQSVHWLEDRGAPDLDAAGNVVALTGVTMDITARREADDALRAAKAEAERANAAKNEFLSRMSHELRTPLNAVLGFGQLLELAELESKHAESVEHILRAGRHLLGLIDEVLDIARIESGQFTLQFEPIHAGELLGEIVSLLHPLAARHDVRVSLAVTTSPGSAHVLADRQRLKQVLLNLLSNAIKYNRPRGEVFVTCRAGHDQRLCLEVRDTGRGLAPEDLSRLFTPFERFGAEQDGIEGTGIGLVIARRLTESMGGGIHVESTPGEGSTFVVELPGTSPLGQNGAAGPLTAPARSEEQENVGAFLPSETSGPSSATPSPAARTVLYIEDNLSNLQLIERIFERRMADKRIALLSAMQGTLGLDLARQHQPDLILLDLQLPDLPGEEVLARLRADAATRDIPVVILSADATTRQRDNLLGAGAADYLTKPLDVPRFLDVVNGTLTGHPAAA